MPLRRLTESRRSSWRRSSDELQREIAELTAILEDDARCASSSPTSSPRSPRSTAPRGARCCSSRPAPTDRGRGPARGRRRPVPRPAVLDRPARAHGRRRAARPPAGRGQARRRRLGRHARRRAARSASSPSPGRVLRLVGRSTCRRCRRPRPRRRWPAARRSRVPRARRGRARRSRWSRSTPTPPASRSAPRRASSSASTPDVPGATATRGRSSRSKDGDQVVGAVELRDRRRGPRLRHLRRPAAALPGRRRSGRRAGRPAAWPASGSRPGSASCSSAPSTAGDRRRASSSRSPAPTTRCPAPSPARPRSRRSPSTRRKGRATGGVRCHRFLKGEDVLVLAWAGAAPPRAAAANGVPVDLPAATGKRDGSGTPPASRSRRSAVRCRPASDAPSQAA